MENYRQWDLNDLLIKSMGLTLDTVKISSFCQTSFSYSHHAWNCNSLKHYCEWSMILKLTESETLFSLLLSMVKFHSPLACLTCPCDKALMWNSYSLFSLMQYIMQYRKLCHIFDACDFIPEPKCFSKKTHHVSFIAHYDVAATVPYNNCDKPNVSTAVSSFSLIFLEPRLLPQHSLMLLLAGSW